MLVAASICFIACHGGPADHFATFASSLQDKGYLVEVYATGPALTKFQDRHTQHLTPFFLDEDEEVVSERLARQCSNFDIVITDVGHHFDITLQQSLQDYAPKTLRCAYYDNPEPFVPGGYSVVAAKVMGLADKVLFANKNLAQDPSIPIPLEKRVGVGFYPVEKALELGQKRSLQQAQKRKQFFKKQGLTDEGEAIFIYTGGNNQTYFSQAFPAFLTFLGKLTLTQDLSDTLFVLQQHPGAKAKQIDTHLLNDWLGQYGHLETAPKFVVSEYATMDALLFSDGVLYYQTSMAPQFVLASIPTIQVGHNIYSDILVRQGLCQVATDADGLWRALHYRERVLAGDEIQAALGIDPDGSSNLQQCLCGN